MGERARSEGRCDICRDKNQIIAVKRQMSDVKRPHPANAGKMFSFLFTFYSAASPLCLPSRLCALKPAAAQNDR